MEPDITPEQAAFFEEKTKTMLDYTIDCYDRTRTDGNNVLQWHFGVITGGMGLIGGLMTTEYKPLALGAAITICISARAACNLVSSLQSKDTMPPGNLAENLNRLLDGDTMPRMRWREAKGIDDRIKANLNAVSELANAVDLARRRFAQLPKWFISGTVVAWLVSAALLHF